MAARFRLSPAAETQIGDIVEYIAADSEDAAVRVRDALYSAFEQLARTPGIGHRRQDLTDRPLKFWSVHSYLVVYNPASDPLTIVAILHGARDVERLLKNAVRER
jgi:plasmid stabilization system protein ParE